MVISLHAMSAKRYLTLLVVLGVCVHAVPGLVPFRAAINSLMLLPNLLHECYFAYNIQLSVLWTNKHMKSMLGQS